MFNHEVYENAVKNTKNKIYIHEHWNLNLTKQRFMNKLTSGNMLCK